MKCKDFCSSFLCITTVDNVKQNFFNTVQITLPYYTNLIFDAMTKDFLPMKFVHKKLQYFHPKSNSKHGQSGLNFKELLNP